MARMVCNLSISFNSMASGFVIRKPECFSLNCTLIFSGSSKDLMNKNILLFNPRSATNKYRIPMSVLQVAASVEGKYDWVIVDGNREQDPYKKISSYLSTGKFGYVGFTVMPGP